MKEARIAKMLLGSLYIGGGLFKLTVTTSILARDPALYSKWVSSPLVPFYKRFFTEEERKPS